MKKPKSDFNAVQQNLNSISIQDKEGATVCDIIVEDYEISKEVWQQARLLEMAPRIPHTWKFLIT
jgi:hypothetical protein